MIAKGFRTSAIGPFPDLLIVTNKRSQRLLRGKDAGSLLYGGVQCTATHSAAAHNGAHSTIGLFSGLLSVRSKKASTSEELRRWPAAGISWRSFSATHRPLAVLPLLSVSFRIALGKKRSHSRGCRVYRSDIVDNINEVSSSDGTSKSDTLDRLQCEAPGLYEGRHLPDSPLLTSARIQRYRFANSSFRSDGQNRSFPDHWRMVKMQQKSPFTQSTLYYRELPQVSMVDCSQTDMGFDGHCYSNCISAVKSV
mgnify:FL=1